MFYLFLAACGVFVGITSVLFGFGGGFVIVPVLYRGLLMVHPPGDPIHAEAMHIAVATSTCVMVINALAATRKHHKARNILWPYVFPLFWFVAVGAALGAWGMTQVHGDVLRMGFVIYIGITIADCLLRKGFVQISSEAPLKRLSSRLVGAVGMGIGAISSFLGVGGSLMTVPLMRRLGMPMIHAVAIASPLAVPVALVGTIIYASMAIHLSVPLSTWHLGYIDFLAFVVLAGGSILGVKLGAHAIHKIPDWLHARIYIGLLTVVFLIMAIK